MNANAPLPNRTTAVPVEPRPAAGRNPGARRGLALGLVAVAILSVSAWQWPTVWKPWLGPATPATTLLVSGNIETHESVLGFKTVQSRITELPFDEGQWVATGTVLARVDDADYRQQVSIAQLNLETQQRQLAMAEQNLVAAQKTVVSDQADLAERHLDYDRSQKLWEHGDAATQARDQASTALHQSQAILERDQAMELAAERSIDVTKAQISSTAAALKLAEITLGYTTLEAPFDGVILVRQAELGEMTQPGTPVVTLADIDHVWLRAYINETDIGKVRFGAAATVTTDTFPGKKYEGRVSFISASAEFTPKSVETHAERVTLVYRIRIDIENRSHELVPGMPADALITLAGPASS